MHLMSGFLLENFYFSSYIALENSLNLLIKSYTGPVESTSYLCHFYVCPDYKGKILADDSEGIYADIVRSNIIFTLTIF